jgi:hypothetical protein
MGIEREVRSVRFRPDTAANPDTAYIFGKGVASVTHAATGQWLVTFKDPAYKIVGFSTGVGLATPAAAHVSVTFANVGTNNALTATISHFTTALADIASDADNWLSLTVEVEMSKAA